MSRRCSITNKAAQRGNQVSHSNRKQPRHFLPNLQVASVYSEALGRNVSLKIAASTLRSIDHNGGVDAYLLGIANSKLTPEALKLKKLIQLKTQSAA